MQDPNYKRLFSFPRMVEDLLRGFLPGQWLAEVDFSTLDKLPAEHVSDELLKHHGDCVWRLRRRGQWLRQGVEQGLEHERALLRRQAASRFGAETAERLSGVLARIPDPEDLAEVGEWLVRCETGSEFLNRVDPASDGAARRGDGGSSISSGD